MFREGGVGGEKRLKILSIKIQTPFFLFVLSSTMQMLSI